VDQKKMLMSKKEEGTKETRGERSEREKRIKRRVRRRGESRVGREGLKKSPSVRQYFQSRLHVRMCY